MIVFMDNHVLTDSVQVVENNHKKEILFIKVTFFHGKQFAGTVNWLKCS